MPGKPGQQVVQLRKLHLELPFPAAGPPGENIEDDLGTVDDLQVENLLEIAKLRGSEVVVKDHQIRACRVRLRANFMHLAASQKRGRIGIGRALQRRSHHLGSGADSKFLQFPQGILRIGNAGGHGVAAGGFPAGQERFLQDLQVSNASIPPGLRAPPAEAQREAARPWQ